MKTVMITGAADGIGKALASKFIKRGDKVIGIDVDTKKAQQTQSELGESLSFIIADLSDSASVGTITEQLTDNIDIMIHNVGISEVGYFKDTNLDKQNSVININLLAPLILTRNLLANSKLADNASIVFISSLSHYVSYPGASVYAGTKSGLASYARSLCVTYPDYHVMTVYPGPTRTAHARRYSPDNTREASRMSPEVLAEKVVKGIDKHQRILIPGVPMWLFAIIGRLFPLVTDTMMRKTLLEKF